MEMEFKIMGLDSSILYCMENKFQIPLTLPPGERGG
jgi:hypothetical protein